MRVQGFLEELGRRLRAARERDGRSQTEVAAAAGLSRRYLTEAEAGRANPSAAVLLRLSQALRVPLRELVDVPLRSGGGERIALVGLRGAGKTTVGRLVARALEVPFVELDRRVEELSGLEIGEVFELHGAAAFHRFEGEALEAVLGEGERVVLATGGSIVDDERNFARLRATCRTVWLAARPAEHFRRVLGQGDRRPMADRPRAMEELEALLARRAPLYAMCDHHVDTSGRTPEEVATLVREACEPAGDAVG